MNGEIERLLNLGRMDLDAGYPEYARQYFEKVLALDSTNREAIEALAQIEAILSRKASFEPRPETQPTEQKGESLAQPLQRMLKRLARLFGTLAIVGLVISVLGIIGGFVVGTSSGSAPTSVVGAIGFLCFLGFGALWFACWALGKLWKQ
jgi:ferric-dicitrate binding protein FerR (iron transport regulator)